MMLKTLEIYYKNILQTFTNNNNENNLPISLISGGSGIGKSFLIDSIIREAITSNYVDAVFKLDDVQDAHFITDLLHDKPINAKLIDSDRYELIKLPELEYNYDQFNTDINTIKSISEDDYNFYDLSAKLKSSYFWASNYSDIKEAENQSQNIIKSNFSKKSTHRLLLDTYTVSIESFIVDLMNLFYAFTDSEHPFIKNDNNKKIIVFAIDNLDSINGTMYMFLVSYLIPYFYSKTFGDFQSYHISFIDESLKVSDLFDFRIIFTSRNSFDSIIPNIAEELVHKIVHYKLTTISIDEYQVIENTIQFPNLVSNTSHFEITQGIPSLVFDKSASTLSGEYDFTAAIALKGFSDLAKYFNETEQKMLYVLAFIEVSTEAYLIKYFKDPKFESYEIENFLLYNSFLLDEKSINCLKPEIRSLIKYYLKFHKRTVFDSMLLISNSISKVSNYLQQFSESEFEILETLAFFPNENNLELSRIAFPDNIEDLESIYKHNRLVFNSSKYIMNSDISKIFRDFVKAINHSKYLELSELPNKLQYKIEEEKERIKVQHTAEIKSLEKEYNCIDSTINLKKIEFKEHQSKLMLTENLMIDLRRQINNSSLSTNLLVTAISSGFTIAIAMIAYFLPNIIQPSSDNSPIYSIQFILYSIFSVLLIFSIIISSKTYSIYKLNLQNAKLADDLSNLEEEKANHLINMQNCREYIDKQETRKKELNSIIH